MKKSVIYLFLLLMSYCFSATQLYAQADVTLRQKHWNLTKGIALQGYDPVAYFTQKKAVEGSKTFQQTYQGVTYWFANKADLDLFEKEPAKYEPVYGGWCAYAMGFNGEKVEVDPETFKIVDGKLNLFYNKFFTNTLPKWNKDEASLKKKADTNWKNTVK
ncbi:MAG: YHS domain-containing (seleno)protein [Bacteroidota bacterium]